jgi:hypothetical protein
MGQTRINLVLPGNISPSVVFGRTGSNPVVVEFLLFHSFQLSKVGFSFGISL